MVAGSLAVTTSALDVYGALARHESLLAQMLVSAFDADANADLARRSGLSRPQLVDNLPPDGSYLPLPLPGPAGGSSESHDGA